MFLDTYGEYISTNEHGSVLDEWGAMPNAPTTPNNVGAIFLSKEESLLLNELRQFSLKDNPKEKNIGRRCLFQ